jgi:hypothetical protein
MSYTISRDRTRASDSVSSRKPADAKSNSALRIAPERRRRPTQVAASLLLVAVCSALFAVAYSNAARQESVLALTEPVDQGALILRSDLEAVRAALAPGIRAIPSTDASQVIGRRASVGLEPGSLLVAADITSAVAPPAGEALVGLALKAGQLPASGVSAGELVDIVLTGAPGTPDTATSSLQPDASASSPGIVLAASVPVEDVESGSAASETETVNVSVLVASPVAPLVANASVAGQVALIVVGPGS